MSITTKNLGRLGGKIEQQSESFTAGETLTIKYVPSGWGKAIAVFDGVATTTNVAPFVCSMLYSQRYAGSPVNGGGVFKAGGYAGFANVRGTLTWYRLE